MGRRSRIVFAVLAGVILLAASGKMEPSRSETLLGVTPSGVAPLPIFIENIATAAGRERAPVAFDHDRHAKALKQTKMEDCGLCHNLKARDGRLVTPEVAVFSFPKKLFDATDKTATMSAVHEACVSCHQKRAAEGKTAGPGIGLCGKCHVKRPKFRKVVWAWKPIFNYARHDAHLKALDKAKNTEKLNVARKVELVGQIPDAGRCQLCHHSYDTVTKKLFYKKDTANSCRACHKTVDEKNARSLRKAAHAACVGCHMKLAETVTKEAAKQGRTQLTKEDKKRFGPFQCEGCHGTYKTLTPDEIRKLPRLVRGQKDLVDISLLKDPKKDQKLVRMKLVPFNHKVHEATGQFCSTCHHNSLERCSNCHTLTGDSKKGGGVPFERAFHKISADRSCLGCHNIAKEHNKCAGCHQAETANPVRLQNGCTVCHRGPSEGKPIEPAPLPTQFDKEKVPEKVLIKVLEKEFKPAEMPHQKIMKKLTAISNENLLARSFHTSKDQVLCYGCHHNSRQTAANKFPECSSCHFRPFNPTDPGKPGMMAAFHQQCTGCHQAMGQKPAPLECDKCHPAKESPKTAKVPIPLRGIPE